MKISIQLGIKSLTLAILFLVLLMDHMAAQTIAALPTTITKSVFAQTQLPFQFSTASSTGSSTFFNGLITISPTGLISGNGTLESYSNIGTLVGKSPVSVQFGSHISSTTTYLTPSNVRTQINGSYNSGSDTIRCADFFADVLVKLSNGFVFRGKCVYSYRYVYNINGNTDESDTGFKLNITGPGGHIGFVNTGTFDR